MGIVKEFKEFAVKGNVLDMAVGVVIGGAFGKIVSSLVGDVIMPLVSILTGGVNFTHWKLVLKQAVMDGSTVVKPEISVNYGSFIQVVIDFVLIALSIFCVIKGINAFRKKKEAEPATAPPPSPSEEVLLLREIRDALKK
jgi:large conductance mechanosensitive channel